MITAVKTLYNGVLYRSALEADWAKTFDTIGIYYQYEPEPLRFPSGNTYDPDFYLPAQRVFCEAKGPHNERLWKARELQAVLDADPEGWDGLYRVIVLRPSGPGANAAWECADGSRPLRLIRCGHCDEVDGLTFEDIDRNGTPWCRRCFATGTDMSWGYRSIHEAETSGSGRIHFEHVTRPGVAV